MTTFLLLILFWVVLLIAVRGGGVHSQYTNTGDSQTVPLDIAGDGVVSCLNICQLIRKKWDSTVRG